MSDINLLLSVYFEEKNEEGLHVMRHLLAAADDLQLTVCAAGMKQRHLGEDAVARISKPFNFIEGALTVRDPGGMSTRRLDVRYRPAVSSTTWAKLDLSFDPTSLMEAASRIHSKEEAEDFQFLLSLKSFEGVSRKGNAVNAAVFEALHHSIPSADTIEKTILQSFESVYPEMLNRQAWGYSNVVPFRNLSISEEWEAAGGEILWADLAISQDAEHQYLFATQGTQPKVVVPPVGVREGELTVYRLHPFRQTRISDKNPSC
jgi:hypothetical protein